MKEKYLVVNADDFGIDKGINKGIAECFRDGIVRSVSIISNGDAFEDALDLVKDHKEVGIGVHLCLVGERAILARDRVPSLTDQDGYLCRNWFHFFSKVCSNKINFVEVRNELEAQINKVLGNGIIPTHLDSHQYVHLIPPIFNIVVELAKKHAIKWIRYPKQSKYTQSASIKNYLKIVFAHLVSSRQLKVLKENKIYCADFNLGITDNGHLNEWKIINFLKDLKDGLTDITCHPGYKPVNDKYIFWHYDWDKETNALKNIKELLKKSNIELINYAF